MKLFIMDHIQYLQMPSGVIVRQVGQGSILKDFKFPILGYGVVALYRLL
jgi:hypothetical protein